MTDEKKAKIKDLQLKLKNMSNEQKQALIHNGLIATIEGRTLSPNNTILCYIQSSGALPTVVGGFKQWLAANRVVCKGQHGLTIWFPIKQQDTDDNEDVTRFFTTTVFDISQTEELGKVQSQPVTSGHTLSPMIHTPTPEIKSEPIKTQSSSNEPEIMKGWTIV
jgi:hypothetical protein